VHPIAFQLGPLTIHWYGVMIALAFLAGLWTATRRARRVNVAGDKIADVTFWLMIGAILGARAVYVATYWKTEFSSRPWSEMFMIQHGGLVYYGGFIGATLAGAIYLRWKKLPQWKMADILAPSIALGSIFGRIGCLLNGCCYGRGCHLPWAIRFPSQSEGAWMQQFNQGLVGRDEPSLPVHPTEIYDALLNLALYFGLAWLFRRKKFDGQVFATYFIGYALCRFIVEYFRGDYPPDHLHNGLTSAQLVSVPIFIAGVALYALLSRRIEARRG
jgi:phosphatidylglycerol---prolipoprotein diacylglyceryl transferase